MIDAGSFLAAYDEFRHSVPAMPPGVQAERDGPVVRITGWPHGGFVEYCGPGGLAGEALDDVIARQVRIFGERGERFEWKTHGHDEPADLHDRLLAAGFVPDPPETVMGALVAEVAGEPALPAGVEIREAIADGDLAGIAEMEARVWDDRTRHGLAGMLADRIAFDPHGIAVYLAEAEGRVICGGWVCLWDEAGFATLHGGATLPDWRGRGVYRALVAVRAGLAAERGCRYLEVDASEASRPILERLGFAGVTTTTPFIWSPH